MTTAELQTLKPGDILIYNDDRPGHTKIPGTVLTIGDNFFTLQFDDRADTTTVYHADAAWINFLVKQEKTKHTPGPWKHSGHLIATDHQTVIATTQGANCWKWQCSPASLENAANARLIAAAPEMLETLQVLRDTIARDFKIENSEMVIPNADLLKYIDMAINAATEATQ